MTITLRKNEMDEIVERVLAGMSEDIYFLSTVKSILNEVDRICLKDFICKLSQLERYLLNE